MSNTQSPLAISLFSSGGIGDLAVKRAGYSILLSNELLEDRHAIYGFNFPATRLIHGDIWANQDLIVDTARSLLAGRPLSLLHATPPCQGMSKNGRGKLLSEIRAGRKPALDERNRLVIPTVEIARQLKPEIVLFENVPEMLQTCILDENGEAFFIIDYIKKQLGSKYVAYCEVVEFADYGVPQRRQRLISIFTRNDRLIRWLKDHGTLFPPATHAERPQHGRKRWISVRDAIEHFPPLDAKSEELASSELPYHRVPLLDARKYWWVQNTPPEKSAFDNQCVACGYSKNPTHQAKRDRDGINRALTITPLYCLKCGELLPRPSVERDGQPEIMRGFTSAYKRMAYDKPASSLTRNLSYACSDNKLHPEQNRVLSLREAFALHTLDDYRYEWKRSDNRRVSDKTVREIIGESIPPGGLQPIVDHLKTICEGRPAKEASAGPLFDSVRSLING